MRINPKLIPHLVNKDSASAIPDGMRRGLIPSQKNISVQDVKDYSTPQGAAMANEEMRKLRMAINSLSDSKEDTGSGNNTVATPLVQPIAVPSDNSEDNVIAKLYTIYHNSTVVKTIEKNRSLNFVDNGADIANMRGVVFVVNASGNESYEDATVSAFAPSDPWYIERFTLDMLDTEAMQDLELGGYKYRKPMYHDVNHGLNNPVYSIYPVGIEGAIPEVELLAGKLRVRCRVSDNYDRPKPFLNTGWQFYPGIGEHAGKFDNVEFIIIVRGTL
jgi:hypothetical protein